MSEKTRGQMKKVDRVYQGILHLHPVLDLCLRGWVLSRICRSMSGVHIKVFNEMAPKIVVTVDHMKSYAQARAKK